MGSAERLFLFHLMAGSKAETIQALQRSIGDLLLWQPRNFPVEMMLSSIYFAMGIVMVAAAQNPEAHKSFIDFLILANLVHAIVMLLSAQNWWNIIDVLMIGLLGGLPLFFYPWGLREFLRYSGNRSMFVSFC